MTNYFGFPPSPLLLGLFNDCFEKAQHGSSEPLYIIRDKVSLEVVSEIIDVTLINLVNDLPGHDGSKETILKVANFCKSTVQMLLRQVLGKTDDASAKKALPFLEKLLHTSPTGTTHMGTTIPEDLAIGITNALNLLATDDEVQARKDIQKHFTTLVDIMVQQFLDDFLTCIDMGMIKRKAANMASSGIIKALHVAINHLIPSLGKTELLRLGEYYKALMYTASVKR